MIKEDEFTDFIDALVESAKENGVSEDLITTIIAAAVDKRNGVPLENVE